MLEQYDLVVIGTGTAAMVAAMRVRAAGWRVAVVDFRPFGGTCALRGCDPKKMLVGGAIAIDHVRRMPGKGVVGDVGIDWPELMKFKRGFTDPIPDKHEQRYREKGIDAYHGRARFTGPNAIQVGGDSLDARHVLIASGAEPPLTSMIRSSSRPVRAANSCDTHSTASGSPRWSSTLGRSSVTMRCTDTLTSSRRSRRLRYRPAISEET